MLPQIRNHGYLPEVKTPSGDNRWEARIKKDGKIVARKRFPTKKLVQAWARRIESDNDAIRAYGSGGGIVGLCELATLYIEQHSGTANSRINNVRSMLALGAITLVRSSRRASNNSVFDIDLPSLSAHLDSDERRRTHIGKDRFKWLARCPAASISNGKRSALLELLKLVIERGYLSENIVNRLSRRS